MRKRENRKKILKVILESTVDDELGQIDLSEVVGTEVGITLGTFALSGVVALLQAIITEHMKAFGKHGVFLFDLARRTSQLFFIFFDFLS